MVSSSYKALGESAAETRSAICIYAHVYKSCRKSSRRDARVLLYTHKETSVMWLILNWIRAHLCGYTCIFERVYVRVLRKSIRARDLATRRDRCLYAPFFRSFSSALFSAMRRVSAYYTVVCARWREIVANEYVGKKCREKEAGDFTLCRNSRWSILVCVLL